MEFSYPSDIEPVSKPTSFSISEDRIFLGDQEHSRVLVFDREGNYQSRIGNGQRIAPYETDLQQVTTDRWSEEENLPQELESWYEQRSFFRPVGVNFYQGLVFVLTNYYSSATREPLYKPGIWVFNPNGEFLREISLSSVSGPFMDVAEETVAVADNQMYHVESHSLSEGSSLGSVGKDTNYRGALSNLRNVTDSRREAYLREQRNMGSGPGQFGGTIGQLDIFHGKILVADPGNQRIQIFRLDSSHMQNINGFENGILKFRLPVMIDVSPSGQIFVFDGGTKRFSLLSPQFELRYRFGSESVTQPRDMQYVEGEGLYVLGRDANLHLFKKTVLDPDTREIIPLDESTEEEFGSATAESG